jgi:aminopeptidase N
VSRRAAIALLAALLAGCSEPAPSVPLPPPPEVLANWTPFNAPDNRHHPEREPTIDVEKYTLRIRIWDTEPRTQGRMEIALKPLSDTKEVALDAADMTVTAVSQGGKLLNYTHAKETLTVALGREAKAGESLTLAVDFDGRPTRGLFWVRPDEGYPDKPAMIWSQGETEYNHFWFPCYDYPNDRAKSETFFTVPAKYTVVSNGALVGVKDEPDGWRTHHWRMDKDHVSYLVSVVVGELEKHEEKLGDVDVRYFVPRGKFAREDVLRTFAETPAMIRFFSDVTGTPYPYPQYAQTVIWDFIWGGMENISATTLHQGTVRTKRAELDGTSEGLIAHELAHQWFGDMVTCRSWAHAWLNEGFATYFEALWQEHRRGREAFSDDMDGGAAGYFGEDADSYRRPVVCDVYTSPDDMFDAHLYPRGAWVLHMLRRLLGDETWWKGIRTYLKKRAWTVSSTDDFRAAMEEAAGQDLQWFFDQWLLRTGYPEFRVAHEWDRASSRVKLVVEQVQKADERVCGPIRTGTPAAFRVRANILVATQGVETLHQVWIDQRRHDFAFTAAGEPLLVAFDPADDILKKLQHPKTALQLAYQLRFDSEPSGRRWAARQLGGLGADGVAASADLQRAVLNDPSTGVRIAAAEALAKMKHADAREALIGCLRVRDAQTRRAVIAALGEWPGDATVRSALHDALENDESWACQSAAAIAFSKTGGVAPALLRGLYEERRANPHVAPALLEGLFSSKEPRAVGEIIKASAYGAHPWLRRRAIELLGRLLKDGKNEDAFATVVVLLEDESYHVRASAIAAAKESGDARAVPALRRRVALEFDARLKADAAAANRKIEPSKPE